MAVRIVNKTPTRALCRCIIPALRWVTLAGLAAVLLFGAPTDALWALGALGATVVSPPQ